MRSGFCCVFLVSLILSMSRYSTFGEQVTSSTGPAPSRRGNVIKEFPTRQRNFKLSTDPFFVKKVWDIVGLYLSPPKNAVVLCVDEKSQIQALERTQPVLPKGVSVTNTLVMSQQK